MCLLKTLKGSEEGHLDAGHVLFCEVGVVLGGRVWAWHQQGHEAGCHHLQAELHADEGRGGGSCAVSGGPPSAWDGG